MARISTHPLEVIINTASSWKNKCLVEDGSLFSNNTVWSLNNLNEFKKYFVDNLIEKSDENFYEKLELQLADSPPEIKELTAEMLYIMLLFPSNISARKKAEDIRLVWSWTGQSLDQLVPDLEKSFAEGVGSTGMAYNNLRWAELVFFSIWLIKLKGESKPAREKLLADPWVFANWLDRSEGADKRQFRHIVLFLLFPDFYETSSSRNQKNKILESFMNRIGDGSSLILKEDSEWVKKDKNILHLRKILTEEAGMPINFYLPPYADMWLKTPEKDDMKLERVKAKEAIVKVKNEDLDNLRQMHMHQLNTILYGPPGTGKTYLTSSLAVEICNGSAPADEVALMEEYNKLKTTGRISFVTFHQSFSYEDFVEGIRPEVVDQQVTYDVKSGVFKNVCELASNNKNLISASTDQKFKDRKLFKMSLGNSLDPDQGGIYQDCIDNNYVLLRWGGGLDYTGCNSINDVRKRYKESFLENEQDYNITSVHYLKNEMKVGDLVLISDGNTKFRAVGEISGEYKLINRDDGYVQMRPVKWIAQFKESLPIETISSKRLSQMSIYLPDPNAINWDALEELLTPVERNYVLIIDEINRANISKVFGELITLIEKEKREQLSVILPYSRKAFTVPKNLYIIGTMNTADRSIATLDTALRRRFYFKEMMPDVSKLKVIEGVDLGQLLLEINRRIIQLYDRDHTIGHAYLMNIKSLNELNEVFKNKIIPLLQEYFYEDWDKLKLVLNDANNKFIVTESLTPIKGLDDIRKIYSVTKETLVAEDFISIYE